MKKMTEKDLLFENLKHVADSIVALFGRNCETCIHDLTNLQHSLTYIKGEVTHREIGAPATDLLLDILKQGPGNIQAKHNYKTTTVDGKSLKSATSIINDSNGQPLAAFCINFDTTDFFNASQVLLPFIHTSENEEGTSETFAHSVEETVEALFDRAINMIGKQPISMSVEEKTAFFTNLEENGTFQFKGAVEQVAQRMGITKYTVYNYLKKIRNSN